MASIISMLIPIILAVIAALIALAINGGYPVLDIPNLGVLIGIVGVVTFGFCEPIGFALMCIAGFVLILNANAVLRG